MHQARHCSHAVRMEAENPGFFVPDCNWQLHWTLWSKPEHVLPSTFTTLIRKASEVNTKVRWRAASLSQAQRKMEGDANYFSNILYFFSSGDKASQKMAVQNLHEIA